MASHSILWCGWPEWKALDVSGGGILCSIAYRLIWDKASEVWGSQCIPCSLCFGVSHWRSNFTLGTLVASRECNPHNAREPQISAVSLSIRSFILIHFRWANCVWRYAHLFSCGLRTECSVNLWKINGVFDLMWHLGHTSAGAQT